VYKETKIKTQTLTQTGGKQMSEISYKQEVELLESMLEALKYERADYETAVNESIDSTMPVYYTDLVSEWTEAGMPQSDNDQGTIFDQMTYSLWECYNDFAYNIISEATSTPTALELVREALGVRKGYADLAQAIIR
jgi:hypothetical protein